MGVWVSGGISGGHINPAVGVRGLSLHMHYLPLILQVTLALATWRGFPWKKVPFYIAAQLLGGLVGGALVYADYFHAIDIYEGGRGVRTLKTASLFSTYAVSRRF